MIEVGKIKNNKAGIIELQIAVDIRTGKIDSDAQVDTRIIKNEEKFQEITQEYLDKLNELVLEDLKVESEEQ